MIWTTEFCPYGTTAYVDENRRGHWGGPGAEIGSLTTCKGRVTICLGGFVNSSDQHIGNVDTYSRDNTDEVYRKAKRKVEEYVEEALKWHDERSEKK